MSPGLANARHLVLPDGIVSTGWPAVDATCREVGIRFDDWQAELNRCILAKDAEGFYAADTVVMSICRQSGKTYDVAALCFADCIIHPGTTIVWTAHRFKVARESFNEMRSMARTPGLGPHIDYDAITTAAGNETIPFRNGSRIVFAARERGAMRGFTKVRRLILDEAQILTEGAMSDLAPTTNQGINPQIILMGTPPRPQDPGEVFTALRTLALGGDSDGVLYVEFSAPPDCDIDDWDAVAVANPSFPKRTTRRAISRLRKLLTNDDDYRREGLGIWDRANVEGVIPRDLWGRAADEMSLAVDRFALGVEVGPDLSWASVGLAGIRSDGEWHVELDEHRAGVSWVVPYVQELIRANPQVRGVIADAGSPTAALFDDFKAARVRVVAPTVRELGSACAQLLQGVVVGAVHHIGQPQLDYAVSLAGKRPLGDTGMWVFSRKLATADITPVQAVTLALWGAQQTKVRRPGTGEARGSREGRKAVLL